MDGQPIERVKSGKVLGTTLSEILDWEAHVTELITEASKHLFYIRQLKSSGLNDGNLLTAYKALIGPVVQYACQPWTPSPTTGDINHQESIQKRSLKTITPWMAYDDARGLHRLPTLE